MHTLSGRKHLTKCVHQMGLPARLGQSPPGGGVGPTRGGAAYLRAPGTYKASVSRQDRREPFALCGLEGPHDFVMLSFVIFGVKTPSAQPRGVGDGTGILFTRNVGQTLLSSGFASSQSRNLDLRLHPLLGDLSWKRNMAKKYPQNCTTHENARLTEHLSGPLPN